MSIKDLFDVAKQNPGTAAVGLFVILIVGAVGGGVYVKANEQRLALMEERLKRQEDISKKQKNVIDVIQAEFSGLKQGIQSLSSNLTNAKMTASRYEGHRSSPTAFLKEMTLTFAALEGDANKLEKSISASEAITRAFSTLLTAALTGSDFDTRDFVSAVSGTPINPESMTMVGLSVEKGDLKPGDLVFFNPVKRAMSHVGIYVGENRFISAPVFGKGEVKVENLQSDYWVTRFNDARRIADPTNQQLVQDLSALIAQQVPAKAREPLPVPAIERN